MERTEAPMHKSLIKINLPYVIMFLVNRKVFYSRRQTLIEHSIY